MNRLRSLIEGSFRGSPAAVLSWLLCLGGGSLLGGLSLGCSGPDEKLRPIILVVFDTVRADHLSVFGYPRPTTPRLEERFREDGLRFTRMNAASNNTSCSHATMFTGLYVKNHGVFKLAPKGYPLAKSYTTVAELLQERGYRTMAAFSASHLNAEYSQFDQGFEDYLTNPFDPNAPSWSAEETTEKLVGALKSAYEGGETRPPFIWLHYFDPHRIYDPPAEFREGFPAAGYAEARAPEQPQGFFFPDGDSSREENAEQISRYDGEIRRADEALERVFQELERHGHFEEALVIFTADHGENLGEKNLFYNHAGLFEQVLRIPLLVRLPGVTESGDSPALVHHVDLMPTILEVAGVEEELWPKMDGMSLLPVMNGDSDVAHEAVFAEAAQFREKVIVSGNHKLIFDDAMNKISLYDLEEDPREKRDLANEMPEKRNELLEELVRYVGVREVCLFETAPPEARGPREVRGAIRGRTAILDLERQKFSESDDLEDRSGEGESDVEFRFRLHPGESKGLRFKAGYGPVFVSLESTEEPIEFRPVWRGRPPRSVPTFPIVFTPAEVRRSGNAEKPGDDGMGDRAPTQRLPGALLEIVGETEGSLRYRMTLLPNFEEDQRVTYRVGTDGSFSKIESVEGRVGYKDLGGGYRFRIGVESGKAGGTFEFDLTPKDALILIEGKVAGRYLANTEYRVGDLNDPRAYPTTMMLTPNVVLGRVPEPEELEESLRISGLHVWMDFEGSGTGGAAESNPEIKKMLERLGYLDGDGAVRDPGKKRAKKGS